MRIFYLVGKWKIRTILSTFNKAGEVSLLLTIFTPPNVSKFFIDEAPFDTEISKHSFQETSVYKPTYLLWFFPSLSSSSLFYSSFQQSLMLYFLIFIFSVTEVTYFSFIKVQIAHYLFLHTLCTFNWWNCIDENSFDIPK